MGRRHHTAFAGRSDCLNSYSNSSTFLPICLAMSGPAVLRICVVVAIPRSVHLTPNSSVKKLQILCPPHGALSCMFPQPRKAFEDGSIPSFPLACIYGSFELRQLFPSSLYSMVFLVYEFAHSMAEGETHFFHYLHSS